ncbi:MAG: GHKL domain-containing protein [Clostridia bacterium]|nr:GHKL domain-containing protein [Clostridia bacterium]
MSIQGGNRVVVFLGVINYGALLLFGILSSLHFSGAEDSVRLRLGTILFTALGMTAQIICWFLFGMTATTRLYPLLTHLPLVLFLIFFCKRPPLLSLVSVLSAYLCCQIARWFALAVLYLFDNKIVYYIIYILALFPLYFLLRIYAAPSVYRLMTLSKKSLLLFGFLPLLYYLFDYATTVYTDALYRGVHLVVEFMPSMVCFFYLAFAVIYYGELSRRSDSEQANQVLFLQLKAARVKLEELAEQQELARYYRHDIRHHLTLIGGYLDAGDAEGIRRYLHEVQQDIDAITPVRYCENETVNLVLSSFAAEAEEAGVALRIEASLPQVLPLGDTELCALLSNALENAVTAAGALDDGRPRSVRLTCRLSDGRLLLLVENPYSGTVEMTEGLPRARREGHGFGVKSIVSITERHNGLCDFTAQNGVFTLRIAL